MNIENLIGKIQQVDAGLTQQANKAVNQMLTIRNWLIGFYIVEFEQHGEDRSKYGDNLLPKLAIELKGRKGLSLTNLNLFRQFYLIFPEVGYILTDFMDVQILQALPGESKNPENSILQSLPEELKRAKKNKPFLEENEQTKITRSLIERLSFTHISLLLPIEDDFKRTFYIVEAIKGVWSSRELKRQIYSL